MQNASDGQGAGSRPHIRQPAVQETQGGSPSSSTPLSLPSSVARGPTLLDRVKDKLPLLEYVKRYRDMKESPGGKGEFFGKCISPEHEDNDPSFYVNTSKQVYSCRGCGISGNVCGAYALINGMDVDDAKFALGRELGVFNERRLDDAEAMLNRAAGSFAWNLERKQDAMDYLTKDRGLTVETIKRFGLGFCWGREFEKHTPDQSRMALDAGLIFKPDPENPTRPVTSFMRGRITFPVKDRGGRVVGFAGRLVPGGFSSNGPKYMNSPETQWFRKSELLYGASEAQAGIARTGFAVVVEGYMDVVGLHQAGINNAMAVMGAMANEKTFKTLWTMTKRVVFCLDADAAGEAGALRSVMAAAPAMPDGCEIAIAKLPAGVDPDEFVIEYGQESFKALCDRAVPLSKFLMESHIVDHNLAYAEGRARFLTQANELASVFSQAPLVQAQIIAEARALNAAALVETALNITGLGENVTAREMRDAIALMQRRLINLDARETGNGARAIPAARDTELAELIEAPAGSLALVAAETSDATATPAFVKSIQGVPPPSKYRP